MIYVQIKAEHCEQLNRSICRMLRPEHLRAGYTTDLYCTMVTHTDGRMALVLPESQAVPIHVEATGEELAEMLAVFVDDEAITQQEADGIVAAVPMIAGTSVKVIDLIPASWSPYVLTYDEMDAEGWFPVQEEEV